MKRSIDRILTTHVGSLPRPADLLDLVRAKEDGKPIDEKAHTARLREAVADVVRKQTDLGIDIVDDGEFGKPSFVSYVNERLGGFEFDREAPRQSPWAGSREVLALSLAHVPRPSAGPKRTGAASAQATGSANRVARLHLLHEPPSIDKGEVTDKGSINQRAVLKHRDALVQAFHDDQLAFTLKPEQA